MEEQRSQDTTGAEATPSVYPYPLKLVVVGDTPVGIKSGLLQTFTGTAADPRYPSNYKKTHRMGNQVIKLELLDVTDPRPPIRKMQYTFTRCFILVFDFSSPDSLKRIKDTWHPEIVAANLKAPVMLLGVRNKTTPDKVKIRDAEKLKDELKLSAFVECEVDDEISICRAFEAATVEALYKDGILNDPGLPEKDQTKSLALLFYPHIAKTQADRFNIFIRSALELIKSAYPHKEENRGQCYRLPVDVLKLLLGWVAIAEGYKGKPTDVINVLVDVVRKRQVSETRNLIWDERLTFFSRRYMLEEPPAAQVVAVEGKGSGKTRGCAVQ
ncbi:MAG TPA: hypothetical protein VGV92_04695 [Gammaproteobacteria bacterium]|nr:hypothetical protein [Gammaproteobacteria bacterium]